MNPIRPALAAGALAAALAACGGGNGGSMVAPSMSTSTAMSSSILTQLVAKTTIASTVDPINGDQNPYGLAIAPAGTAAGGIIQPGDLIVCNFNNAANVQGLGTTLEDIKPVPGSKPTRLAQNADYLGCAAIALGGSGNPWIAAWGANDNPIVTTSGALALNLTNAAFAGPWGQAFSGTAGATFSAAFYESNAGNGSIVRIDITSAGFVYDTILTGLSVNGGAPGNILAPAGLTYSASNDTLYIVDSNVNKIVAIKNVTQVPAAGIQATDSSAATTFTGPAAASASVVYAGPPLNAPISAALLYNGDLVVGNTGNNDLVEIAPSGRIAGTLSVDSGAAGAIFGVAAEGSSLATTELFFNDDNTNSVIELSQTAPAASPSPSASPTSGAYAARRK